MANNDLAKKQNVALHSETYKNLSTLAAKMRIDNGGKFVSMSEAVDRLIDAYENPTSFQAPATNAEENDQWYLNPQPGQKGLSEHIKERRKIFDEKLQKTREWAGLEPENETE